MQPQLTSSSLESKKDMKTRAPPITRLVNSGMMALSKLLILGVFSDLVWEQVLMLRSKKLKLAFLECENKKLEIFIVHMLLSVLCNI